MRAYFETFGLPGHDHELLEQLRAVPVPGEGHPALHDERARRRAAPDVRVDAEQARVAARARPLRGDRPRAPRGPAGRDVQRRLRRRGDDRGDRRPRARADRQAGVAEEDRPRSARARPPLPARRDEDPRASSAGRRRAAGTRGSPRRSPGTRRTATGGSRSRSARRSRNPPGNRRITLKGARFSAENEDRAGVRPKSDSGTIFLTLRSYPGPLRARTSSLSASAFSPLAAVSGGRATGACRPPTARRSSSSPAAAGGTASG